MAANAATIVGTVSANIVVGGTREYSVKYLVETTDAQDQALTAIGADNIPFAGSSYLAGNDYDAGAFARSFSPKLVDEQASRKLWEVIVNYSSQTDGNTNNGTGTGGSYEFPWLEPAQVFGSGTTSQDQTRWHYANPTTGTIEQLTNSAGAFYDDEYTERSHFGISVSMNYSYANWSINTTIEDFVDCLNSQSFFGAPAGYYKMAAPRWSIQFTGDNVAYWQVQYEFQGLYGGWNGILKPDEGYYYIDDDDGDKQKRFADDELLPISGKGRLDGFGDRLASWADTVYYPSGGINKYREADFGNLGIPTSAQELISGQYTRRQISG